MTCRPVRILLVEDNQDTLNFLATILARKGHHVRTASDLASALRSASAADFDLLISDIELPDGTGLELMRTIRSSHPVPGIAVSGFGSKDDIAQSRTAGFDLHLTKPVDFRRLEQAILHSPRPFPPNAPAPVDQAGHLRVLTKFDGDGSQFGNLFLMVTLMHA